ncbi:MAG: ABC-F family ATP-binding cassette domain-containing protein [Myxococcota bacterium]
MLLQVHDLSRTIGDRTLFSELAFQIRAGDRLGLVGPNGAGKSTLLRVIAGEEPSDGGRVSTPRGVRVARLRQEIDPRVARSVHKETASALGHLDELEANLRALEDEIARLGESGSEIPAALAERYDHTRASFEYGGGFERDARVAEILAGLGFDEAARGRPIRSFSGGWLMRVELAKLFLSNPDVLLLDEPTNHLDLPAIEWFEGALASFPGGAIVVSHDRSFLERQVSRIAELDGYGSFEVYEGGYDRYLAQRSERRELLRARKARQDRQVAHMEQFVERFRAKATKARQAQSRLKAIERMERIELAPERRRTMRLRIPEPPRAGKEVLALEGVHKSYGENPVYRGIDFKVARGERVALAGPNGSGKSTLLRIAAGVLEFDTGERSVGHNVEVAFFAQHQLETLDPSRTVLEELENVATMDDISRLRSHLGAFLFSGDDVKKRVSVLSGGEKARLALARLLLRPSNFIVLDEPTNHLDLEACQVLEDALARFSGSLLFVSHDRSFINAIATRVVEVRAGTLRSFPGNYDDYLRRAHRSNRPAPESPVTTADRAGQAVDPEKSDQTVDAPSRPRPDHQVRRRQQKARDRTVRRIERLEAEILEREKRQETLVWELGSPDLFRDPDRMRELEAERSGIQEEIDALYSEWERRADELASIDDGMDSEAED